MIEIEVDKENRCLAIFIKERDPVRFTEVKEALKDCKCHWNPTKKQWEKSIYDYDDLVEELKFEGENVESSEYVYKEIQEFKDTLKELEVIPSRVYVNYDLMKCSPLKGIGENVNFQDEDIRTALRRNRYLFHWEMGLGKSYALACLIENLRWLKKINKCLIFSTGVGVFNLKDELLKFGKNLRADDIFVLNSMEELSYDERDLFNIEKYPQSIIILTYDSFKSINDYYYDKAHIPARLPKKLEEAETELNTYIKKYRENAKALGKKANEYNEELKSDKTYKSLDRIVKKLKEDMHPSRHSKYNKSCIPIKEWLQNEHGALFLDEVHSLGNPKSDRSKIFEMNIDYFKYRYEFTGTLADKYEKLYEPLYILDRDLVEGKTYQDWLASYCEVGNRWSKYAVNSDSWDVEKIAELNRRLLKDYCAKRKMNECLNLPLDYDVPTIYLEMSKSQRDIYEGFIKEQLKLSEDRKRTGEATVKDSIMNMFGLFQLAVDNPECCKTSPSFEKLSYDLQAKIMNYSYKDDSYKLKALKEIVKERVDENGEKGLIWYFHPLTKDVLKEEFKKYSPIIIEAGMDKEERNKLIMEYKNNPNKKLLIGSINVMNTSLTLTEAKWQAYLEKTYNFTVYTQSRGRIHRPGQTDVTRTYDFCYKSSIDFMQKENLETKGQLLNSLVNKDIITNDVWKKIFNANKGMTF